MLSAHTQLVAHYSNLIGPPSQHEGELRHLALTDTERLEVTADRARIVANQVLMQREDSVGRESGASVKG